MNSELLDRNFGLPEECDGALDISSGHAICCRFNRLGTLIAVGSNDGRVFLFDVITRGLVKSWSAHVKPISSLDWSRTGRFLLTASADSSVAIWNVLDTAVYVERFHYGACINPPIAMFNPRNESQILVLALGALNSNTTTAVLRNIDSGEEAKLGSEYCAQNDETITAIAYDRRGTYALLGTAKGRILIYDTTTMRPYKTIHQQGSHQIRSFLLTRKGNYVMVNSFDRIVRCYRYQQFHDAEDGAIIECKQKFQDMVNKTPWKLICASNDGEYVCGASTKTHSLHVWEMRTGDLIKILHGAKGELLTDVQWHPFRPVILSVANGVVSVWTQAHVENWSAFAPDFTELETNKCYEEREAEFDTYDSDADEVVRVNEAQEEDEIDVERLSYDFGSSDEEMAADGSKLNGAARAKDLVWFLPVQTEVETETTDEAILYKPHGP